MKKSITTKMKKSITTVQAANSLTGDFFLPIDSTTDNSHWKISAINTTNLPTTVTSPYTWNHHSSLEVGGIPVLETLQDLMAQVNILAGEVMKLKKELKIGEKI